VSAKFTRNWEAVRAERPLNERRVATYERLMDAEERIAQARHRHASDAAIDQAVTAGEPTADEIAQGDDLYLGSLARYVAALGGHLEVAAVFPDETIVVRRDPAGPTPAG
jgi:hypothetical protein